MVLSLIRVLRRTDYWIWSGKMAGRLKRYCSHTGILIIREGAVNKIREALRIPVFAHRRSDEYLLDARKNLSALCGPAVIVRNVEYLDDGDLVALEANPDFYVKTIYVPGHTTDSVMFYSGTGHVAFVRDTILGKYRELPVSGRKSRRSSAEYHRVHIHSAG